MRLPLSDFGILKLPQQLLLQWPMNLISVFCVSRIYNEDCTWDSSRVFVFSFFLNLLDPAPAMFNVLVSLSHLLSTDIGGGRADISLCSILFPACS